MGDANAIFEFARSFADRSEVSGSGTDFPTVRATAKRFRMTQQAVIDAVEDGCDIGDYFGISVGIQTGGGYGAYDSVGDYKIEAYRSDTRKALGAGE